MTDQAPSFSGRFPRGDAPIEVSQTITAEARISVEDDTTLNDVDVWWEVEGRSAVIPALPDNIDDADTGQLPKLRYSLELPFEDYQSEHGHALTFVYDDGANGEPDEGWPSWEIEVIQ